MRIFIANFLCKELTTCIFNMLMGIFNMAALGPKMVYLESR
jgi:hypothetical protein